MVSWLYRRVAVAVITALVVLSGLVVVRPAAAPVAAASYHSININGDCSLWTSDEKINGNDGTQTWITWDASTVYLAWLGGGGSNQRRIAAFDLDAATVDGSNISYSGVTFPSVGQPDYIAEVSNNTTFFTTRTGSSISTVTNPSGTHNWFSTCGSSNFVELSVPRSLFSGGSVSGLPTGASLGVYSYFFDPSGGGGAGFEYGGMPQGKIGSGTPTQTFSAMDYFATTDGGRSPSSYGQVVAEPGDANIQWNGLFADQSSFFMSPVEVSQGGTLTLRFRSYHGDLTSANVNWLDTATNTWSNFIPMHIVGQDATGKYDIWQADASALLASASTKFYRFQLNDQNATTWYNSQGPTCGSGTETSCQAPDSENFWVIPNFSTPAWSHAATFYQIFPDRFRDGDSSNDLAFHSSTAPSPDANNQCPAGSYDYGASCAFNHTSWNDLPAQPAHGTDFFGGDLAGINQELDPYLKQTLGVNALYLNPIFKSPSNHKYDTQDYYTVDPHFGTNTGSGAGSLTSLIGKAHSTSDFAGDTSMSVMLDGVFNHTGDWNCWFNAPNFNCGNDPGAYQSSSSQYYSWYKFLDAQKNYCAWDGFGSLPQLNYSAPGVRDQIYRSSNSVMQSYLKPPYNVDGWRLDVADNYSDLNNAPSSNPCQIGVDNHQIWQEIRPYVKGANPNSLILGEYWQKPTDWLGGNQWDSVMNYNGFAVPVSEFFTGQNVHGSVFCGGACDGATGYLSPSGLANWLTGALADNNRDSQLSMLNSLSTHDTSRFLYRACTSQQVGGNGTSCLSSSSTPAAAFQKLKMATELQMTFVGMPSIYYGDEIGMTGGNDPDNRRPFDWNQADWNQGVFNTTRTLVYNRTAHQALRDGSFKVLLTDDTNNVFAFGRFSLNPSTIGSGVSPSDAAIVMLNNDGNAHTETVDATQLSLVNGTQLTDVLSGQTYTVQNGSVTINLAGNTGAVLVSGQPASVPAAASFPSDTPVSTTTAVTSSANPSTLGSSVTFTATVSAASGTPSGTIQFTDNGNNLGSAVSLNGSGQAAYSTSSLAAGSHTITALYTPAAGTTFYGSTGTLAGGQQVNSSAPAITSANSTTFASGVSNLFTVVSTGAPTPHLSESGSLPNGVTFVDNHDGTATLSGTPLVGTAGSYPITITASNGVGSDATQSFTLTVSPVSTTTTVASSLNPSTVGSPVTFTATVAAATGTPNGTVQFTDNGNNLSGVQTLDGSGAASVTTSALTSGTHTIEAVYTPGTGSGFQGSTGTLAGGQQVTGTAPAITSGASASFTIGTGGLFTVTTSGNPTAHLSESGNLPNGLTFVDNNNGTATLSGTALDGTAGNYPITITASNGVSPDATQSFTITIDLAPSATSIVSSNNPSAYGDAVTFTATVSGASTPSGTVQFTDNGTNLGAPQPLDGSGQASFTTSALSLGTHTIGAVYGGSGANAASSGSLSQQVTGTAPAINSANSASFTVGIPGSFTVTSTGNPTAHLSESGTLPGGITFTDNGDGTATLSGTPASGTLGSYPVTITAANTVSPDAAQSFTVTVTRPPTTTTVTSSLNPATFASPVTFSATVTSPAGTPTGSIEFTDNGANLGAAQTLDGSGNASITTSSLPVGTHTIQAVYTPARDFQGSTGTLSGGQQITGTPPSITSGNSATFTIGVPSQVLVTATGSPAPHLSESGSLPGGITFAGNGDGTATIGTTAAADTQGSYPITITASNGISPDATQSFTITVVRPGSAPQAITRQNASPTDDASVSWNVSFATSLSGLTASNFTVNAAGGQAGASITSVTPDGGSSPNTLWHVTAATGSGDGTLGITLANDTNLSHSLAGLPLPSETYTVDRTAPVTTAAVSNGAGNPPLTSTGIYRGPVQTSFTAADGPLGTGVQTTYYAVDTPSCTPSSLASCQQGTAPFSITVSNSTPNSGPTTHTVTYFSQDVVGNIEQSKQVTFTIDTRTALTVANATCSGSLPYGSVVTHDLSIPAGASCVLDHVSVGHDLTAGAGSQLTAYALTVSHDLNTSGAAQVQLLAGGSVGHDLSLVNTSGGTNSVCGLTVGHDVLLKGSAGAASFVIGGSAGCGNAIGHDTTLLNNAGPVTFSYNQITHDLDGSNNPQLVATNNQVGHSTNLQ
jgi:alpha-glucosidase